MKNISCAVVVATALIWSSSSEAGVFELEARVHAGGMLGQGFYGDLEDRAFYDYGSGLTYGFLVGAEVLFVNAWIQHDQYIDDGVAGTFTQFLLGFDVQFDLGDAVGRTGDKPEGEGYSKGYGEVGFGAGFGVATRSQVEPPLSDDEITDKALLFQLELGFGYRFTEVLSVGVHFPIQTGYFILSKDEAVANDLDNHYGAMNAAALLTFRANFSL